MIFKIENRRCERRRREKPRRIRGAVAQLEERLICIQQVIGSNPFGSTKFRNVFCE